MTEISCPHCQQQLFRSGAPGKLKARTTIVVLHKSRDLEINCGHCGGGVIVGALQEFVLRKAAPRLVLRTRPS